MMNWTMVHFPLQPADPLPPERKIVLVWCEDDPSKDRGNGSLPYCGYVRYAGGDEDCPFFVVYHGNDNRPTGVIAWCDCLPEKGPEWADNTKMYDSDQLEGRGFPARSGSGLTTDATP